MSQRLEEVKNVFSSLSSTPMWGTIGGDRRWWTTIGAPFARSIVGEGWENVVQVCRNGQGGQLSEAGQQSQGKRFVDVERRKDKRGSEQRSE